LPAFAAYFRLRQLGLMPGIIGCAPSGNLRAPQRRSYAVKNHARVLGNKRSMESRLNPLKKVPAWHKQRVHFDGAFETTDSSQEFILLLRCRDRTPIGGGRQKTRTGYRFHHSDLAESKCGVICVNTDGKRRPVSVFWLGLLSKQVGCASTQNERCYTVIAKTRTKFNRGGMRHFDKDRVADAEGRAIKRATFARVAVCSRWVSQKRTPGGVLRKIRAVDE